MSPTSGIHNTVASNLNAWRNFDCSDRIPSPFLRRIQLYATETELRQSLIDNKALFHCYSVKRLHDAMKKIHLQDGSNVTEEPTPKKTRRSLSTATPAGASFFCDGDSAEIKCETRALYAFVSSRATVMKDTKLIAKLSEGKMFATDAMYHKRCMTDFYNKSRSSTESSDSKELRRIEGNLNMTYFYILIGTVVSSTKCFILLRSANWYQFITGVKLCLHMKKEWRPPLPTGRSLEKGELGAALDCGRTI